MGYDTPMLILFDIDGTLLLTRGAGVQAMRDAGRELFGERFTVDGVEFSGRLDPLIWRDLAMHNGVDDAELHHEPFRAAYRRHITRRLTEQPTAFSLPGVAALIEELQRCADEVTLGVLTGNYPETGRLKLERAGLSPDVFTVAAWGIDGPTRRDLPPIAFRRYHEHHARTIEPERVVIIGDTPHDVDCALHNGCRALGVATGAFSTGELLDAGAHHAMENLSAVDEVMHWLMKSPAEVAE
jgi:phosphoglycolate phosphatase